MNHTKTCFVAFSLLFIAMEFFALWTNSRYKYSHPLLTFNSIATQPELPLLNGFRNTYFCGSYFGYGFHEDAVKSAVAVARSFGIDLD